MGRHKTISKGFDRSRDHGWFVRTAGKKRYYATEKERDDAYDDAMAETKAFGFEGGGSLSAAHRLMMTEMLRRSTALGASPMELFELGIEHWSAPAGSTMITEVVALFHAQLDAWLADGTLRKPTVKGLRHTTRHFAEAAGTLPMHAIDQALVETFAGKDAHTYQTRFNRVAHLARFCSWAVRAGHLQHNPVKRLRSKRGTPEIFKVDLVERIIRRAEEAYLDLLPLLILQWLVGMRPSATHGLCWEHIDFTRKRIVIPVELSKSGEPEIIDRIQPVVWVWLRALRKPSGRIANGYHVEDYQLLKADLGIKEWPQDVARHTFASHLYALTDSMDAVANALLHQTTRVTLKHYVAFGVTKAAARRYFSLRPRKAKSG
jgi:integrase